MSKVKFNDKKFISMTWEERSTCIGLHGDYKILSVAWFDRNTYKVYYQGPSGKSDFVLAETLDKALVEMEKKDNK